MEKYLYERKRDFLVLSADRVGGFVAPGMLINHVPLTQIYGDGKVVFIDPAVGSTVIHEGRLTPEQINELFQSLIARGFWSFADSYTVQGPADMQSNVITARGLNRPEKRVSCYGGELSAPDGFMECFDRLVVPRLAAADVHTYVRQPITQAELDTGWYYGFEYQKKLNTPRSWVWVDAGRSSRWRQPEPLVKPEVTFDSGYMLPGIDGCHHIRIHYHGYGAGATSTIQLDRNAMSPNEYGDIGMTTLMYFAPQPVTLTLIKQEDKRHLFGLESAGYHGPKLRLCLVGELDHPTAARLLVVDDAGAILDLYCMHIL